MVASGRGWFQDYPATKVARGARHTPRDEYDRSAGVIQVKPAGISRTRRGSLDAADRWFSRGSDLPEAMSSA
jgi:hypothetical protein